MYKLARMHLDSVGSNAARFNGLTLDFTDDEHDPLDTIIWLRNGGGKTSLLSLLFSLFLPYRRDFLGAKDDRKTLGDYVLSGDTAHVLCEWDTPNGPLVTGAVYEWPERRRPPEHEKHAGDLVSRFYAFVPKSGVLSFDERPLRDDAGRRRSLETYVRELRSTGRAHPLTGLVVATTGTEWKQALLERGIDPAVFRYQKEMNKGEGAIDEQFRFTSGEAFVNFLIDMAVDPDASDSVSARMSQLADKLAKRPATELELAYCEGVAERLGPIASTWADLGRHRLELDEATAAARELSSALHGAHEVAAEVELVAEAEREEEAVRRTRAETARTAARDRAREYTRRAAVFWVADAKKRGEGLDTEKTEIEEEQAGWSALDDLFAEEEARRQIGEIDRQLSERAQEAEPLRLARNEAARRLHWRYVAQRESAQSEQAELLARAHERQGEAERLLEEATGAGRDAGRLGAEIAARRRDLEELDAAMESAVAAGHLALGEEVSVGLARAESQARDALASLERLEAQIQAGAGRQNETVEERTAIGAEITKVEAARAADSSAAARYQARAAELSEQARIRELAQSDNISLWGAQQMLDAKLSEEIERADGALVAEAVAAERDTRNLAALGEGGLLPPSEDTIATMGVLEAVGIGAVGGLAYLAASVPRRDWDATIDAHPGLLSGALVEAADFEAACAALIEAGLRPGSLVTLAKKSDLTGTGEDAFVVPPSTALFDTAKADEESKILDKRLGDLDRRNGLLVAGREVDRGLRDDLRRFIEACPMGHLDVLDRRISLHDQALIDLGERRETVEREAGELAEVLGKASTRRSGLTDELLELRERISVLRPLCVRSEGREELAGALAAGERDFAAANEHAATSKADAATARKDAEELRGQGAVLEARVSALGERLYGVELRGSGDWELKPLGGDTPTEALERELAERDEEYRGEISDPVLEDRRRRAAEDRSKAERALDERGPRAQARAEVLRHEPEALDVQARAGSVAALATRLVALLREQGEARADLVNAESRLRECTPSDRQVYRELLGAEFPQDRDDAERRGAEADAEAARQQTLVSEADQEMRELVAKRDAARARKDLVKVLADGLDNLASAQETDGGLRVAPFAGSDEEARQSQVELAATLKRAKARFEETENMLNGLVGALRTFAARSEFEAAGSLREAVVVGEVDDVSRRAAELAESHDTRAAVLRADLANISADQEILVTDLADQVRRVLDLLKKAPATSKMDHRLGEWGGKSFLTLSFDDITMQADELARRVSGEVDAIVAKGDAPEGLATLKRAVHAAVPGGFKVRVLKPTADLREERVPVSAMAKWSGGEKLTAAVVLYCVIARLRARNRSRELLAGSSGALVLDNPLGKASFVGFLALQRRVAEALGVQLLYTTAVRDLKAVGTFPNVIRCRNRTPVGSDRGYVTAQERAGEAHGTSIDGFVSSARVVRLDPPVTLLPDDDESGHHDEGSLADTDTDDSAGPPEGTDPREAAEPAKGAGVVA